MPDREIGFTEKDAALRADVSLLGSMVGELLVEQCGTELFERVEAARKAAIRRRQGGDCDPARPDDRADPGADNELAATVADLSPAVARELLHAFSIYFQVVNLAERVHRIRRLRGYLRDGEAAPDGLEQALAQLAAGGLAGDALAGFLGGLVLEPVFTAHPTEATRRTILRKHQRIARRLVERLDPARTPHEEAAALAAVRAELTSQWQTEEHPRQQLSVADEREHVLFFLTDVIYRIVPAFYEAIEDAIERVYGEQVAHRIELPRILRFASWVGGDMDGNPNVTAATVRETLARQRSLVLDLYYRELRDIGEQLSQSSTRVGITTELAARLADYGARLPGVRIPQRHRDMPYRSFVGFVAERLQQTLDGATHAYADAAELRADLDLVAASLRANRGVHAGLFGVRRLTRRVATFGFHLAALDVRQDALVHRRAVGQGLADPHWLERSPDERVAALRAALTGRREPELEADAQARATLEVFGALAQARARYGSDAVGNCIISMAQGADDVLAVLLLARWGGLVEDDRVPLAVVPLFETMTDLEQGPAIMDSLFRDPSYRAHLAAGGDRQMVMVGYSDSNKDGGLAAARWALQRAQGELVTVADRHGVELTIFHGRGGSVSRGGGKTHKAVLGAPPGAVRGRLRVTEQGEIINAKYGLRGIAMRTLEQALGSVMVASALAPRPDPRRALWHEVMSLIARESRRAYRALVYEEPRFTAYFRQATPIDVIERMRIGSRPASRRSGSGVQDLRAIPWVFAWTQNRQIVPGWYGLGSGLVAALRQCSEEALAEMVREWPFFGALIDDVEMVLAKTDPGIGKRYAALAEPGVRGLYDAIAAEHERTVERVLRIKGSTSLLDDDPTLQRAIRLRNPYIDPMSLLQVDLLARWRAAGSREDDLLAALLASVNGIAHGLVNTG